MRLTFLGGAGTVTGSKYLVEAAGRRVLVDCGLFQGLKALRLLNWGRFPVDPAAIDAVVLTHAHLDHSGYLPLLVRNGFRGSVHCTAGTRDLCAILLPDSGFLQEREAEYANRHGFSKHKPALPLYTAAEAIASLDRFEPQRVGRSFDIVPGISACLRPAGHILGATMVELSAGGRTILFSGDLGRPHSPTMLDPAAVAAADFVVVESTYGDRTHVATDPEDVLADIVVRTARRGGSVLIPTFAVGRVQTILFHIHRLKQAKRIPDLPVFVDSPMATAASKVFANHLGEHRLDAAQCRSLADMARYVDSVEESKRVGESRVPRIILSASGMATGGRVLHHLKVLAPDRANTILFAGFQAAGTRGAAMVAGARSVKIHGGQVPVAAEVANLDMLSAHADRDEILNWLANFTSRPAHCFVTHGEPVAAEALRAEIVRRFGWACTVPTSGESADLSAI
ncbi:MAG: MBL fold metallo-hydrolase [Proteobacteria bacterium]|nr:MBL fold metallo-hydrolase [Pseudomonadota bacterium]